MIQFWMVTWWWLISGISELASLLVGRHQHLRCHCPRVSGLQRLLRPSRHGRPSKRRVHHPAKRRGRSGRVRAARIFLEENLLMVGGFKKKGLEVFFFLVKSELRSDFHHFFAWKSCWGDWIVKSVCSFFQTSWGGLLIHDLRQASPYQSFVGQDQSPKRAGKWWQFRGHGIKKKGAKTVSFCRKTRGFQKGKLGWKGFGVMKPPKFGQEVGWIMKNYAEEEDWQTTPFFNLSIRSPPSNKKLWDKKHQTQIR